MFKITVQPTGTILSAQPGQNLLELLRSKGLAPDAPCGGNGKCGKCAVRVDGKELLSCQASIDRDMTVELPRQSRVNVLTQGIGVQGQADGRHKYVLAFDIGTTTVVCYLLSGITGEELARDSALNPQTVYGADVISRIQQVMDKGPEELRSCITRTLADLALSAAVKAGIDPEKITLAAVVGNTAMHHLFLGIDPTPLTVPPYMPTVSNAMEIPSLGVLPIHPEGTIRVLPNIAGFVGADTVGCMASVRFDQLEKLTLMIDIGTNGEMVLGDKNRRITCSTAAGPAFEGAKISCGMRGAPGAVDHAAYKNGEITYHTIGDCKPIGLCGSGLLDLVAALLDAEIIDETGRMEEKEYRLSDSNVILTQKDVREVQLAKSAIRAGIELLAKQLGVQVDDIQKVYLAGAFGSYMTPASACRIGMIPPVLEDRIQSIGNAAGEGAKLSAISEDEFTYSQSLAAGTEFLELASCPEFQDCYVDHLMFEEEDE